MEQSLIYAIIISTSLWMALDARKLAYDKRATKAPGPIGWFFFGLILWIVAFPMYVARRGMLKESGRRRANTSIAQSVEGAAANPLPKPSTPLFLATFAASVLVIGAAVLGPEMLTPTLPACDSSEVTKTASNILAKNPAVKALAPKFNWSSTGEVRSRVDPPRRVCRTLLTSNAGDETLYFAVDWQQRDKRTFFVQLLGDHDDGK